VTENNVTTTYIYLGLEVVYEATSTGTACYIYGPSGRLAKRTTVGEESNVFYYSGDYLGSTRLVTDENKSIVVAMTYHPFGEVSTQEGTEHNMFTGKELDETGLYYYGARYYDSELGRFITRDPLGGQLSRPQSLNRFAYCQNNPLKYLDPWGEKTLHDIGGGGSEEEEQSEQEQEEEEEEAEVVEPENPGDGIPYDDGYIYLETNIHKSGNVGVAIGTFISYEPFGEATTGIVIFLYDDDGNIEKTEFYSFDKLFDPETKTDKFDEFVDWLEEKGVDLEDFDIARESLESECESKEKSFGNIGGLIAAGSVGAGTAGWVGGLAALGIACTPLGLIGISIMATQNTWDVRGQILGDIGDHIP
jgi:RHS repeat-associated protein